MKTSEQFWNASLEEIKNGYIEDENCFTCLLCGEQIEKGIIYPVDRVLYEAQKYMIKHIEDVHGSVFEYLNSLDKKITGLSEHQSNLLNLFYQGKNDHEVQKDLGIGSASTIRNHRFTFKEKERQSKIFLVLMDLLKEKNKNAVAVVKPHKTATMVDDRYAITEEENEKLLSKYFPQGITGKLTTFSMQEKHKLVVLREITKRFDRGRTYKEKELNEILKNVYENDYVAIRRYLIEYGFMDRNKDCSEYWVKDSTISSQPTEKVISGVYQIRNTQNQKIFIASGRNISKLNGIRFDLKTGSHRNKTLQSEWNQYGEDAFVFEILDSFEEAEDPKNVTRELKKLEKKWIDKLQPFGEYGYNKK
ncbi:hypothetical protein HNQ80_001295 [Anaerosolibacter carboniphilus]|uniref:DUF2087 domain-containing protein n=1 Tax=Anaerosolibacter carboniphilus TaxID=1417629 RepID=A0A841KP23_9FIRM|nr:DUF2087 domain-containing protein [Anaerosolibacter carboniphilus]MBB6215206.1 hypothetical protein [Anaerosolibacter carboniphilus]